MQAEKIMADLPKDSSSSQMAAIREHLRVADSWECVARNTICFANHRTMDADAKYAELDRMLPDFFQMDEFNDKCLPELEEAWIPPILQTPSTWSIDGR